LYFDIYRKLSSETNFSLIKRILAAGNSNNPNYYAYQDNNVTNGTYDYKLKMIDANLSIKESELKAVEVNCNINEEVLVYPIPATDELTIFFTKSTRNEEVNIQLYSLSGQIVLDKRCNPSLQNTIKLDVSALSKANYILQISNLESGLYRRKISIAK
jgi:hypothetical protein